MSTQRIHPQGERPDIDQGVLSPRESMLANLASLVNSISREIELQTESKPSILHLTPLEISVMAYIDRHPGAAPCETARDVGLQRSNLSAILRSLSAKRLVESIPDREDGRKIHLYPTEAATRNVQLHRANWATMLSEAACEDKLLQPCLSALGQINTSLMALRRRRVPEPKHA